MALDPRNYQGKSPEVSEREGALGVYVYEPKDEHDEVVGEKKYVEARDPAHAEAFLRVGYRLASDKEAKEYRDKATEAKSSARQETVAKEADAREDLAGSTGASPSEEEVKRAANTQESNKASNSKVEDKKENK